MLPEKLPKPSRYAHDNDPQTEAEWEEYFRCRKKYDRKFSPKMVKKISDALLKIGPFDKRYVEIGKLLPFLPEFALGQKNFGGLKNIQNFNLYDAKEKYPDEF